MIKKITLSFKMILLIIILSNWNNIAYSQSEKQSKRLAFKPAGSVDGLTLVHVDFTYKVINSFGMISLIYTAVCTPSQWGYQYKGKEWYDFEEAKLVKPKDPVVRVLITGPDGVSKDVNILVISGINGGALSPNEFTILIDAKSPEGKKTSNYKVTPVEVIRMSFENTTPVRNAIERKLKSDAYDKTISKADEEFRNKNWTEAKKSYSKAISLLSDRSYPREQLEKIKAEEQKSKNADAYKAVTKDADDKFNSGNFTGAKQKYEQAAQMMPDDNYPKGQLQKIKQEEEKLAAAKKTGTGTTGEPGAKSKTEEAKKEDSNKKDANKTSGKKENVTDPAEAQKKETARVAEEERKGEEARKAEAARKAEEEKKRVERKQAYDTQKQQQTASNFEDLAEMGAVAFLVHYSIGSITYADVSESGPGNVYPFPSLAIEMQMGYGITSAPMYVDVSKEEYDGNKYTYDKYAEATNIFNLDYNFKTCFWPMQGPNAGYGLGGGISAGHSFVFESFNIQYFYGAKAYIGSKTFKLYTEYNMITRNLYTSEWLDSKVSRDGKSVGTSHQLKAGLRINTEMDWGGPTMASFELLPVFELDQRTVRPYGNKPLPLRWANGLELGCNVDNRLHIYARAMWNIPIFGETQNAFTTAPKSWGSTFSIGVLRNISFYANPETMSSIKNDEEKQSLAREKHPHTLYLLMPSYSYFNVVNKQFNYQPDFTFTPIGYGYEYFPHPNFSLHGSALFTYQQVNLGIDTTNTNLPMGTNAGEAYKMANFNIEIPVGIKYHNNFNTAQNYWLSAAYNKVICVSQSVDAFRLSDNLALPKNSLIPLSSYGTWQYAIGTDFNLGDNFVTAGIAFEKGLNEMIEGAAGTKINSVRLIFGFKYK